MVETRMDTESSRGIGMRLLAPRLNNRNLIFFGSPVQQPRPSSLQENYPWEEHCSETHLRSSPFVQTLITNYYTHTHIKICIHPPPPIPRLRRFEPPA